MKRPFPERYIDLSIKQYEAKPSYEAWQRNVIDEYKNLSDAQIRDKIEEKRLPYAILMTHINLDYNLGNILRIGNCLGAKVYYYGEKRWDRRPALGVQNYSPITYLKSIDDVKALRSDYDRFVALEQTEQSVSLHQYKWQKRTLIMVGNETDGLQASPEILELADDFVVIPQRGSVRSLNASTACAIAAYDYLSKGINGNGK